MLTLELSSYLLEIPSQWCLCNTQSRILQADWLIFEINEQATLDINMPYLLSLSQATIYCCLSMVIEYEYYWELIDRFFLFPFTNDTRIRVICGLVQVLWSVNGSTSCYAGFFLVHHVQSNVNAFYNQNISYLW